MSQVTSQHPRTRKKILYIITKSNWGGAQQYVYNLATSLPKDSFDVAVALGGIGGKNDSTGLLVEKLRDYGIRQILVRAFMRNISVWKDFSAFFELLKILGTEQPDIVHLNSSKAGGVGALAARLAGTPKIIFTSHGLAYDEDRNCISRFLIWLATWITFLLCHHVIVISSDTYRRARTLWGCSDTVHLIYNGITTSPASMLDRDVARQQLQLPPKTLAIGTIAELTKNKNVTVLIAAAGILKQAGHNFIIAVVGDGENRAALAALLRKRGLEKHVLLLGFVPNAAQYLPAFDIFVLPSLKEGLPYVILEAGQAGLPVVGSNIAGIEDIVAHERTGLLFDPKDAESLALQLERLITNAKLRNQLGTSLQTSVAEKFSSEKMLAQTLELYQSRT